MTLHGSLAATVHDDAVEFRYEVANDGEEDVTLQFSDAQTHDVVVREGSREVWQLSAGQMFAQMLQSETIPAGDAVVYEATWEDPESGEFEAVAFLAANDADCEAKAAFQVE